MSLDLEAQRERYLKERPAYERLARLIEGAALAAAIDLKAPAHGEGRAKEVSSFLKKLINKQDQPDPYAAVTDKAGARLTFRYRTDVTRVADELENRLDVLSREDKAAELNFSELGYLGLHLDVAVGKKTLAALGDAARELEGLRCEIQLRTNAESAWAEISHDLLYKAVTDVPGAVKRAIYRFRSR